LQKQLSRGKVQLKVRQDKMTVIHKTRTGRILSNKMDKTVIVGVETVHKHPLYNKSVKKVVRYKAHDSTNACAEGDIVRIVETRPLSKEKHWRVAEIITKKEKVEVQPKEIA
jgi:small subunit ribosomal protein S17